MDRILKERYKYTSLEALLSGDGGAGTPQAAAQLDVEAEACLVRGGVPTGADFPLGNFEAAEGDPILANNLAVAGADERFVQGTFIDIPANFSAEGVLYIHCRYPERGGTGARYTLRNRIRAGRGAKARIVVYHHPCVDGTAVINALTMVEAEENAGIEVITVTESRASFFETVLTSARRDGRIKITTIDLDNGFLRRNQFATLAQPGAECALEGVFITSGTEQADNYVRMYHAVPNCNSDQLFKGVAGGDSHGIFTGHIYVAKDAQKTVALQENHNIVLSDTARIDTRPQLEIYADDVKCNHGATIGRLDPEAIYYMRQRGIGVEAARRLQIEGFIDEIVDHGHIEDLGHLLREKVGKRLQSL